MLNRLKEQFLPTRASHEAVRGQRPYHSTEPHAATTTHAHPPRSSTTAASPAATSASAMHERRSMHRPTTCSDLLQQREATRLRHASNSAPSMPGSDTCTTSSTTTSNNDAQSRRSAPPCDTLLAPATQRKGDSTDTHNSNTCHTDATADDELGGVHAFPHVAQLRGVRPRSETCKTSHLTHPNNTDKDDDDRVVVSDACEVLVSSGGASSRTSAHAATPTHEDAEFVRFRDLLRTNPVNLTALRVQCWHGCPERARFVIWMYLTGCWHPHRSRRVALLQRRRAEYLSYLERYYHLVDWDAVCRAASRGCDETALHRSSMPRSREGAVRAERQTGPKQVSLHIEDREHDSKYHTQEEVSVSHDNDTEQESRGDRSGPEATHCTIGVTATYAAASGETTRVLPAHARARARDEHPLSSEEKTHVPPLLHAGALPGAVSTSESPTSSAGVSSNVCLDTASEVGNDTLNDGHVQRGMVRRACCPPRHVPTMSVGAMLSSHELLILRQIRKDVPRSAAGLAALAHPRVQAGLERILFIWSLRHPACGYVQGMNDVVMMFMRVALAYYYCPRHTNAELEALSMHDVQALWDEDENVSTMDVTGDDQEGDDSGTGNRHGSEMRSSVDVLVKEVNEQAQEESIVKSSSSSSSSNQNGVERVGESTTNGCGGDVRRRRHDGNGEGTDTRNTVAKEECSVSERFFDAVESDVYWAASYLLDAMQDNYTQYQEGVVAMMSKMAAVLRLADGALYEHLVVQLEIDMPQFAYRWMNCLLLRELTLSQAYRLFDVYLADETKSWTSFHVYVCVALLLRWSTPLYQEHDYGRAVTFLQNLPTESMTAREMDELLSEAFLLQNLYGPSLSRR